MTLSHSVLPLSSDQVGDKVVIATGASQQGHVGVAVVPQHGQLSPYVEARLTDVVGRLRSAWVKDCAVLWADIYPISKLTLTCLDEHVVLALREKFVGFSQFVVGLEHLLLQAKQLGVVREEGLLSLQELVIHPRNGLQHQGPITYSERIAAYVDSHFDKGCGTSDERCIHVETPVN